MTRRFFLTTVGATLFAPALCAQKTKPAPKRSATVTLIVDGMT